MVKKADADQQGLVRQAPATPASGPAGPARSGPPSATGRPGPRLRLPATPPQSPAPAVTCTVLENPLGLDPDALFGIARRYNARRSVLFVSRVLGKHVPAPPAVVALAGELLAARVAGIADRLPVDEIDLTDDASVSSALTAVRRSAGVWDGGATVIAFAETATALGHLVAAGLRAPTYLHTTRAELPRDPVLGVEEVHSHATSHRLYHRDPAPLGGTGPVVVVDDELTTGRTALATIAAVHAVRPRDRYVVATLLDWRDGHARACFEAEAERLGTTIDVVSLAAGTYDGVLVDGDPPSEPPLGPPVPAAGPPRYHCVELPVPPTARLGWSGDDHERLDGALPAVAGGLAAALGAPAADAGAGPVLCVGTEELMYVPLRIAEELSGRLQRPVRYQSTTRSPVVVADLDGYPVRHGVRFAHHDDPVRTSRLHNVAPGDYDDIVVFVEGLPQADGLAPMLEALGPLTDRLHIVHLVEGRA